MKQIKMLMLYLRIEWNWRFILQYRRKMKALLTDGIPKVGTPEYEQILIVEDMNSKYCCKVTMLTQELLSIS